MIQLRPSANIDPQTANGGKARSRFTQPSIPGSHYLVDAAFLYPWALNFRSLVAAAGLLPLVEMGVFMALLAGGFVYAWKVGALDW